MEMHRIRVVSLLRPIIMLRGWTRRTRCPWQQVRLITWVVPVASYSELIPTIEALGSSDGKSISTWTLPAKGSMDRYTYLYTSYGESDKIFDNIDLDVKSSTRSGTAHSKRRSRRIQVFSAL